MSLLELLKEGPPIKDKDVNSLKKHKAPFVLTRKILNAFYPPTEFVLALIYASLGYGKSSYAIKSGVEVLMNVYRMRERDAWEAIKSFIVFHPQQFFDKLDQVRDLGLYRIPGIIWDDAGLWLYALDWNDPFIKALGKYMNVARSRLASITMTTPSVQFIASKLRGFPDAYTVSITKYTGAPRTEWLRKAKGYQDRILPDQRKRRVYLRFEDKFNCYLNDEFYRWYRPLRDAYEILALDIIKSAWKESKEKSMVPELNEYPDLRIPDLDVRAL